MKVAATSVSTRCNCAASGNDESNDAATDGASSSRTDASRPAAPSTSRRYSGSTLLSTSAPKWNFLADNISMKYSASSWAGAASSVVTTTNVGSGCRAAAG